MSHLEPAVMSCSGVVLRRAAMEPELQSSPAPARNSDAARGVDFPRERILLHPEDHIGSVEKRTQKLWVFEFWSLTQRVVNYVPGLYKIFDEILVFAADNKQRDHNMDLLSVDIDVAQGRISVCYNGQGIPIEVDQEEEVYVPEMIFGGHYLSNCDRDDAEITGYGGVKLANIFSTEFIVEIVDRHTERKYKQVFSENMRNKSEPQVTVYLGGDQRTRIIFKPDLAKFNMTHLDDDDSMALMRKRIIDVAVLLGKTAEVVLNGQMLRQFDDFGQYVDEFIKPRPTYFDTSSRKLVVMLPRIYERVNDQWEVCVSLSEGLFQQVSYVNKIATTAGGTHVDYVSNQIVARVLEYANKSRPEVSKFKEHEVKRYLLLFINASIENPTFDSPTKEALTTPMESFGSTCELSYDFVRNVANSGLLREVLEARRNASRMALGTRRKR